MPTHIALRRLAACLLAALAFLVAAGSLPAAELKVSTSSLSFVTVTGASPAPQQFTVSTDSTTGLAPAVTASTQAGNWLAASSSVGGSFATNVVVTVTVKSSALAAGDYSGQITVSQAGLTGSPATVAVSLKVITNSAYLAINPATLTINAATGIDPAPATLSIVNSGAGSIRPSAAASTSDGSNWLAVSQPSGGSFGYSTSVQVHSASLAAGTYKGTVTITSAGALNSPVNVPVTLTVGSAGGGPTISVAPSSFSFVAGLGANPYAQPLAINNTGSGTLRPTTTKGTNANWLVVSTPIGGSFGSSTGVTIGADITGLAKGTYNSTVVVSDPSSTNKTVTVPVLLTVDDPKPVLSLMNDWIVFGAPVGETTLHTVTYVTNLGTGAMPWTAQVSTQSGGNWLAVGSASGIAAFDSVLDITVNTKGLPAALYNGEITITAASVASGQNPQKIKITMAVGVALPSPNDRGIVNGASFATQTVAAGSLISIFGERMGPATGVVTPGFVNGKLPTELAGVQVFFNGTAAPLYYVSALQINVMVPLELTGENQANMMLTYNGIPSKTIVVPLRPADPGVFLINGKPAIFFNNSATMVTAETPAAAGDYLVIYATGLGALDHPLATGKPAEVDGSVLYRAVQPVAVYIGGAPAQTLFAGLTPGFVGLYQINIRVPDTAKPGANSLIITAGSQETAPMSVTLK